MKITFICPNEHLTGGNRVIAIYAKRLADRGHQVNVVIPREKRKPLRYRIKHAFDSARPIRGGTFFDSPKLNVLRLDHPGPVKNADAPIADIVIGTWWETVEWVWSLDLTRGRKVHFAQDYENFFPERAGGERIDAVYALPIPKIVIAQWVKDLLRERWGQKPVSLIPNAVETDKFFAPERGKNPTPLVGFTYSGLPTKGCDMILTALNMVRDLVPGLGVVAFGAAERPPLPHFVDYRAFVPDAELRNVYASCDAWLFGTRREGFGLPILEAMACRTPVIGTAAGAAPELLAEGGGRLIPIDDVDAMVNEIVKIAAMPDGEWRALSNKALATAMSRTWDMTVGHFESALVSTLSTRPISPADVGGRPYIANPTTEDWVRARSDALHEWS